MVTTRKAPLKAKTPRTKAASSSRPAELLLEIGTEELPYQFVAPALRTLQGNMEQLLKDQRLSFGTIRTIGTPRRLVVLVEQLATHQAAAVKETMGPSKAVAFDQAGNPTKAAIGFAGGQGIPVEQLEIRPTPKGDYVFAAKQEAGRPAVDVLAQQLPKLFSALSFPKAMHWNETGVRFARPIRWLVALCHDNVLPVEYAGVTAGAVSYGHRFAGRDRKAATQGFPVRTIAQYLKEAERHGVIADQERRRAMILEQLAALAQSAGGTLHHDEELVEQAVYAVEYPHTILGSFQPHYLSLPKEVLMTSMKEHQGFFALVDRGGALLPNFLAVTNMKLSDMQLIREGNERVLAARLADAKFFFDEDRKTRLADRVTELDRITFHQKLGTVGQKQRRIKKLCGLIATRVARGNIAVKEACERAAGLCKADLVTGVVGEFPTLQGLMGGEYAKHDGEAENVRLAIQEQYLPNSMEGQLPQTLEGKILSLADRLDNLAAFFHVGIIPTGSEDPFALRRHATALVRIVVEGNLLFDMGTLIDDARHIVIEDGFKGVPDSEEKGRTRITDFILDRVRHYARTLQELRDDVIEAILRQVGDRPFDLVDLVRRMRALHTITSRPEFDPLIIGFKRAHRLCEKEQWDRKPVDPALFGHQAEAELYQKVQATNQEFGASIERGDYGRALDLLVRMKEPIDAFFAGVMVNADDAAIRGNRLSLLKDVDELFMAFADFSQIVVQGS
jgi:glycyl-tRNA synthetase beta chain